MTAMKVRLLDVMSADLPLIERWLRADHVRPDWGEPEENLRLLQEPPASGSWRAVIEADGRKVGLTRSSTSSCATCAVRSKPPERG